MTSGILQSGEFTSISNSYLSAVLSMLIEDGTEFAITTEYKYLVFDPPLPEELKENFGEMVLFAISGYSFSTAIISDQAFSFEAGFGTGDFGSLVSMPPLAIKQIFVEELPIVANLVSPVITSGQFDNTTDKKATQKSMQAILNNPKNQKFIKKIIEN